MALFSLKFRELLEQTPGLADELDRLYKRLSAFLLVAHNDDGSLIQDPPAQISDLGLAVGTIVPYAGSSAPTGWMFCDGTAISRATYATLFTVIGTTYGSGDGLTTFNVPDLRQKFPLGKADSGTGSTLGATGGAIDHTHTGPSHTHAISSDGIHTHTGPSHTHTISSDGAHTHSGSTSAPVAIDAGASAIASLASDGAHTHGGATGSGGTGNTSSEGAHTHGGATGASGAGNTGSANAPFLALNYLILYA